MCFKNRKAPTLIVSGLSAFVVIFGAILLVMAIIYETNDSVMNADLGEITDTVQMFRSATFAVVLIFAIVSLLVGAFGLSFNCKPCRKSPCAFAAVYGVSIFLVWIVFIIVGSVITGVSNVAPDDIGKFCALGETQGQLQEVGKFLQEIDGMINNSTATTMCSDICPCDDTLAAPWLALDEPTLNYWNRTTNDPPTVAQQALNITSLKTGGTVTKYADCIYSYEPEMKDNTAAKILTFFEKKYTCSGVCKTGLFYFYLDLSKGIPTETCILSIQSEVKESLSYLGITVLVSGLFMLIVWIFQYCLWRKFEVDVYDEQ